MSRHTVSVHLTEEEVARLDEIRAPDVSRSAFMRALLRSAGPLTGEPSHGEAVRLLAESARGAR
jgi:ribbon-helix-helix CopG family protein